MARARVQRGKACAGGGRRYEGKRAAGYIRVSAIMGRDKDPDAYLTVQIQRDAITAWADREGITIVRWFEDEDLTGRDLKGRQIDEVISGVVHGEFDGCIVYNFSRWGRNAAASMQTRKKVLKAGGFLLSTQENLDDDATPIGEFSLGMLALMAEYQSNVIPASWSAARENRRSRGLTSTGGPRWGYVYDKKTDPPYTIDAVQGPLLAACYADYIGGMTFAGLVRKYRPLGLTTREGAEITAGNLRGALDSGSAAGFVVTYQRDDESGAAIQSLDTNEYADGTHPQLIDRATWDAYVQRRADTKPAPRHAHPTTVLAGLVFCAICQSAISIVTHTASTGQRSQYRYYVCNRRSRVKLKTGIACTQPARVNVQQAEAEVQAWLLSLIRKDARGNATYSASVAAAKNAAGKPSTDTTKLAKTVEGLEAKRDKAMQGWLAGVLPDDVYQRTGAQLSADLTAARGQLKAAQKVQARPRSVPVSASAIEDLVALWAMGKPDLTGPIAAAVRDLVEAVTVTPAAGSVQPTMAITPTFDLPKSRRKKAA